MMFHWALSTVVFFLYSNPGAADYIWNCGPLDDKTKQKSIPDIYRLPSLQERSVSLIGSVYLFTVPHLNANCRGTVSAIKYCYQIDYASDSEAAFNWTVLILNSQFTITNTFAIESHPGNSHKKSGGDNTYCDTTFISGFGLSGENFTFGVVSSVQGNTPEALLLAFHAGLDKYKVNAVNFPAADQQLTKGSTVQVDARQTTRLGVRALWFVIDEPPISVTTSDSMITQNITTGPHNQQPTTGMSILAMVVISIVGGLGIIGILVCTRIKFCCLHQKREQEIGDGENNYLLANRYNIKGT